MKDEIISDLEILAKWMRKPTSGGGRYTSPLTGAALGYSGNPPDNFLSCASIIREMLDKYREM